MRWIVSRKWSRRSTGADNAMGRVLGALRTGTWLTRERVRLVAIALLFASSAGLVYLVATAQGGIDLQGRPLGTDFSNVYAAGTYVNDGDALAPFDPAQQFAREQSIFGASTQFYGWHYPPYFLFVAAALAKMPYGLALAVWQAASLVLYLLAIWAILRAPFAPLPDEQQKETVDPLWLLLALAYPAVLINIGHGQNGFLTAALLGGALAILDRRPLVAGVLIGLLAYKPQFGLMIPLALGAGGYWRSFAAAALTAALLTLLTTFAFGPQIWHAFLTASAFTRDVVLEQGNTGWYKIQSVFSWARMWGANVVVAYAIQGAVTVAIGIALIRLWRSAAAFALKAAALCLAAILATPYSLDYDMMVLAPAIAFVAADGLRRGFGSWEKTALAALWLVPLVARSVAQLSLIPLGVPAMLGVFVLILWRAELGTGFAAAFAGSPLHRASPGLDAARK
jgi:alpha-1,2-mannosyltransferase